jgi:putative efflux protein, MATE family
MNDYLLDKAPIKEAVIKLCVPTIISSLVMIVYNLSDTYFVGMLNNPLQNAAITIATPILNILHAVSALFGIGSSSLMSRLMGLNEEDKVYACATVGVYFSLFCAVIISAFLTLFNTPFLYLLGADDTTLGVTANYVKWIVTFGAIPAIMNVSIANMVRAEGSSFNSSLITMSGCILNIILDPLFILPWGLNMGIAGAGLATCISNGFACLMFFIIYANKKNKTYVTFNPKYFKPTYSMLQKVFIVGLPAMISTLLSGMGVVVLNKFVAQYGTVAIAAMGIAFKVDLVPVNIIIGLSNGIMPLIGYNYGKKNIDRINDTIRFMEKFSMLLTFLVLSLYLTCSEIPISLFIKNPETVKMGGKFLVGLCVGLPFYCFDFIAQGVFQASGLGHYALAFTLMRNTLLQIPMIILMKIMFGLYGIAYSYLITEFVLGILGIILIRRLLKKWKLAISSLQE